MFCKVGEESEMTQVDEWNSALQRAESVFREVLDFIDIGVVKALEQLPELEERRRGGERLVRYRDKSVEVALGLKLIQLRGSLGAGMVLIENGYFLEWDVVQRTMRDALEDVTFLAVEDIEVKKVQDRYLESFFDEDLDKNGELTDRRGVGFERREVRNVLRRVQRDSGLAGSGKGVEDQSRRIHRLRSGSVHGRAASIMRAYVDESSRCGLWLGGTREPRRVAWERCTLYLMASWVASAIGVAGAGRWRDDEFSRQSTGLSSKMRAACDEFSGCLKRMG